MIMLIRFPNSLNYIQKEYQREGYRIYIYIYIYLLHDLSEPRYANKRFVYKKPYIHKKKA